MEKEEAQRAIRAMVAVDKIVERMSTERIDLPTNEELAIGLQIRQGGRRIVPSEFFADIETQEKRRAEERAAAEQARILLRAVELAVHEGERTQPVRGGVRRLTRVECVHDILYALHMITPPNLVFAPGKELRGQDGPLKIAGVSYYSVRSLPAPGWRIIGPGTSDG